MSYNFFSECSMSQEITSSIDSLSSLNRSFLSLSYVSLVTRSCGKSDLGDPFFPGIKEEMIMSNLNTLSMLSIILYP